ncbi:hypothetical protein GLX30_30980 [Streptomyces sp. Tu 2975]|uniref:DUF6381 family protein n=1 Tax=Streptomyces sp. Tu 2975 TaxID=2676871 RepID=UPI00135B3188|nr:DUF6381 family protein [Streptomyces sp. Tu 2975]QIP87721.1 hypothetical protein GLX30_30980 [Streptomyces sp. Tu 2975]
MAEQDSHRVHAEHDRDKAERLFQQAGRTDDPEQSERLRYRAERLRARSEAELRREPGAPFDDPDEEGPQ